MPEKLQQDFLVGAILHVASRMDLPLPIWEKNECTTSSALTTIFLMTISIGVASFSFLALL